MEKTCPRCYKINHGYDPKSLCQFCGSAMDVADSGIGKATETMESSAENRPEKKIIEGKYRLLELLGTGGMGEVYKAQQLKPIKREVALKIIKLGMDTNQVMSRFDRERQALAVMDHPNIAQVYDAGSTPEGRPYFVMELVRGVPLNVYCDTHKLSTKERIDLFITVCQAVQHAHQKGVIHRDLKPSNVIVGVKQNRPAPKIIDFGVAKATGHKLTDKTLFTEKGQLIGTPEYMSPEQAEMSGLDIDTRADVYSLGVMLYELLVGVLPFESNALRQAGISEIQRTIREVDPPRASTRISSLGDTGSRIAKMRKTDIPSLRRTIKGDLDWIVFKAMEKDRVRRYTGASDMAADLQRYLNNEPVTASPPSTLYKARKYVGRHRFGVAAASIILLAMLAGIIGTSLGLIQAKKAQRQAAQEAKTAEQVSGFLIDLFEISDPNESKGNTITAREILDKGADDIRRELKDQPITRARLMDTMGQVYMNLGLYTKAESLLDESLTLRRTTLGENSVDAAKSLDSLSVLYLEKGEYEKSESNSRQTLEICEERLDPRHLLTADILNNLGNVCRKKANYKEAESIFRRALSIREELLGEEHPDVASCLNNLAIIAYQSGRLEEAEPLFERSIRIYEKKWGGDHPQVVKAVNNLGLLYYRTDRLDKAEARFRRCLTVNEKAYGPDHPNITDNLHNLGLVYNARNQYASAEEVFKRIIRILETAHGLSHPDLSAALDNLAITYCLQERYQEGIPYFEQALENNEKIFGSDHPDLAYNLNNLAATYGRMEQPEKAVDYFKRSLAIREKSLDPDHYLIASSCANLAIAFLNLEVPEEAEQYVNRASDIYQTIYGQEHPSFLSCNSLMASVYKLRKEYEKSEELFKNILSIAEKALPPDHRVLGEICGDYSLLLKEMGRDKEALDLEERSKKILGN